MPMLTRSSFPPKERRGILVWFDEEMPRKGFCPYYLSRDPTNRSRAKGRLSLVNTDEDFETHFGLIGDQFDQFTW